MRLMSLRRQELERFAVAVRPLARDPLRRQVADHRRPPPFLALLDVREVHLDDGHPEELDRVADRVAVVRPRAGVEDDAVRPVERVVAPVDELALVVRLPAARRALVLVRPRVDAALELGEREAAVVVGVAPVEHVEVDAVQDCDPHGATLTRDQRVERRTHVGRGQLDADPRPPGRLEQDEPRGAADGLLVARERRPGAVAVDADRLRPQRLLDGARVEPGEPERGEQAERDGASRAGARSPPPPRARARRCGRG